MSHAPHTQETLPEETQPEEALPEATQPEETLPEETLPAATLPEEETQQPSDFARLNFLDGEAAAFSLHNDY